MTEWVNDFVGVPYLVNGRDRKGWDCWGLVLAAFLEQRGIVLPDWRVDPARDERGELAHAMATIASGVTVEQDAGRAERIEKAEPWAIVLVMRHQFPNHVGVVVGDGMVLHCAERTGGTVCQPLDRFERENPRRSYWRWKG